jgi:hypothetical protein
VFGNREKGTVTRTIFATYGKAASLGGEIPLTLKGTGSVMYSEGSKRKIAGSRAFIGKKSLVLVVDTKALAGAKVLFAELYGTDKPPKTKPNQGLPWTFFPTKILFDDRKPGVWVVPSIPVVAPQK